MGHLEDNTVVICRLSLCFFLALSLTGNAVWAHGGLIKGVSTVTLSSNYLTSDNGSDGSIGAGYRHGFLGIFGLCVLADLDYRFERAAVDLRVGADAWFALFFGLRGDLLIRQSTGDDRTIVGGSLGGELMPWPSVVLYAGANVFAREPTEGVLGFTWLYDAPF